MANRFVPALLIALLMVVHGQLWFGRGSVGNVATLQRKLEEQKLRNLKEGLDMVEEKARSELGMVKPNEIFVQVAK
jgi:cell division protein FtsB